MSEWDADLERDVDLEAAWFWRFIGGRYPKDILSLGFDPNTPEPSTGKTALIFAAREGHSHLVALLMGLQSRRVDPNLTDNDGTTALMIAAQRGHDNVVSMLLNDPRVDPNLTNGKGQTAYMLAIENNHPQVVSTMSKDSRVNK